MHFKRNNINKINTGQKVWQRAKKIIPGGTMLFQKILIYFFQINNKLF